jgi:hypothetical protein
MNRDEFVREVAADPNLSGPIGRAAEAARAGQFTLVVEGAAVALAYPVVRYILVHIGLPWTYTLGRYSEYLRHKVQRWIDEQYRKGGFDPDAAEAASEALGAELERTTDASARASWERLAGLLKAGEAPEPRNL